MTTTDTARAAKRAARDGLLEEAYRAYVAAVTKAEAAAKELNVAKAKAEVAEVNAEAAKAKAAKATFAASEAYQAYIFASQDKDAAAAAWQAMQRKRK